MQSTPLVFDFALVPSSPMTPNRFTASLEQSAAKHPPSKTRSIAALLPQIEAAMAQGSTRAHIVTALLDVGIAVTPHQLSNVIARLRRQREVTAGLPEAMPALNFKDRVEAGPRVAAVSAASQSPPDRPVTRMASVPTLAPPVAPAPTAGPVSKFGAHDPRLLDEVMRSTPDMKALAKLAPKAPR